MTVKPPPAGFPPWTTAFDIGRVTLGPGYPDGSKVIGVDWSLYQTITTSQQVAGLTAAQRAAAEGMAAALGTTLGDLATNPRVSLATVIQIGPNTVQGRMVHVISAPPDGSAVLQIPSAPNFRIRCGRNALTGEEIDCELFIGTWGGAATLTTAPVSSFEGFTPEAPFIPPPPPPAVLPETEASVTGNLDQTMVIFPPPPSETITYDASKISGALPPAPSSKTGGPPTLAPQTSFPAPTPMPKILPDLGTIGAQAIGGAGAGGIPLWLILGLVAVGVYVVWKGGR